MAKFYIISIGGSGALSSESLVHLCATGLLREHDIKFLIVDPDQSNANVMRLQQTIINYKKVRRNVTNSDQRPYFFGANIDMFDNVWNPQSKQANNLENGILITEFNKEELKRYRLLTNLLFSEEKRKEKLDKGYKGNPMIGTIFMNNIKNSEDFKTILNTGELNLFVFGSLFGGTGAAGLPVIGKTAKNPELRPTTGIARVGACITFPYFSIKPPPPDMEAQFKAENVKLKPDSDNFLPAVKFALPYYIEKGINKENGYDSIYVIGCPESCRLRDLDFKIGGTPQKNDSHYINMYSASSFVHFANNIERQNEQQNTNFYATKIVLKDDNLKYENLIDLLKIDNISYLDPLYLSSIYYLKYFVPKAKNENKEMTWFSHKTRGLNLGNDFATKESYISPLKEFMELYLSWIAQMKENKLGLSLFNTSYYIKSNEENSPDEFNINKFNEELIGKYYLEVDRNPKKSFFSGKDRIQDLNENFNAEVTNVASQDIYQKFLDVLYLGSKNYINKKYLFTNNKT